MSERKTDQYIALKAGDVTMDVAEESILREAQRTGQVWMPRVDIGFVASIRARYRDGGVSSRTVDAVLGDVHRDALVAGLTPELAWITSYQAIVVLESLARLDGVMDDDDHSLLAHYAKRHSESTR